jgi:hypothetical protein
MKEEDPIVAEVRQAGDELFKRFNYDMSAVISFLRARDEAAERSGHPVVSLPPRRMPPEPPPAKRAAS